MKLGTREYIPYKKKATRIIYLYLEAKSKDFAEKVGVDLMKKYKFEPNEATKDNEFLCWIMASVNNEKPKLVVWVRIPLRDAI